jgi:hypothetical protein
MKFTIPVSDLASLLKAVAPRPRKNDVFILSACAARVFVEFKGDVGGVEALVFGDGAVTLPVKTFRELLKTYEGRQSLTLEAGLDGLHIENFRMPVLRYGPSPKPPANFKVFPITGMPGSPERRP